MCEVTQVRWEVKEASPDSKLGCEGGTGVQRKAPLLCGGGDRHRREEDPDRHQPRKPCVLSRSPGRGMQMQRVATWDRSAATGPWDLGNLLEISVSGVPD